MFIEEELEGKVLLHFPLIQLHTLRVNEIENLRKTLKCEKLGEI